MMSSRRWDYAATEVGSTLGLLVLLWFLSEVFKGQYVTPLPTVLSTFRENWLFAEFGKDVVPSLERIAVGYGAAVVVGTLAGLTLGYWRVIRIASEPIIGFLMNTPGAALLPLFMVLFGVGSMLKFIVIFFICVWPITLNTADGIDSIHPTLLATASSYGITGWLRLRKVILPAISPRILAGMRVSLSLAILVLIVAEMVASTSGIGYFVLQAQQTFSIPQMWSGTLLLGILGIVLNGLFGIVQRRILRWQ